MTGLWKAIKNFKEKEDNNFKKFACLCIKSQVLTAIEKSNQKKNQPLNSRVSTNELINNYNLEKLFIDPEEEIAEKIIFKELMICIKSVLSPFERKVLNLRILGYSYQEMSQKLKVSTKSIDNALSRIKKKVKNCLS